MGKRGLNPKVLRFVPRIEWQAVEATSAEPLEIPATHVLFTSTDTAKCYDKELCSDRVLTTQEDHMENKSMPDIAYNFLIGGDGAIYEGRGWTTRPSMTDDKCCNPKFEGKSILIAYIGKFDDENFPDKIYLEIKDELIKFGIQNNYIKNEFHEPWQWEPVEEFDDNNYPVFLTAKLLTKEDAIEMGLVKDVPLLAQEESEPT